MARKKSMPPKQPLPLKQPMPGNQAGDEALDRLVEQVARAAGPSGARLFAVPREVKHLDSADLMRLEREFRRWAEDSPRADVRLSRRRILLAFLLLRHTGARLGEVLGLDLSRDLIPARDLDPGAGLVRLGEGSARREVRLAAPMAEELAAFLADPALDALGADLLRLEPGHLRRKFYERAEALGLSRDLGSPTVLRRSRAIELLQGGAPLPLVQRMLGHSTPSLAGGWLDLKPGEAERAQQHYVDREARRTTSARNSFFGRITALTLGDIQCLVELTSVGGHKVSVMITNESRERMGLEPGSLARVEVKAPWVQIARARIAKGQTAGDQMASPEPQAAPPNPSSGPAPQTSPPDIPSNQAPNQAAPDQDAPRISAGNRYPGVVERITPGRLTCEVVLRLEDNTRLCAIIAEQDRQRLGLSPGDTAWAFFNAFAAVLHVD